MRITSNEKSLDRYDLGFSVFLFESKRVKRIELLSPTWKDGAQTFIPNPHYCTYYVLK